MATVDRRQYIDRAGMIHTSPCVVETKEITVNSNKIDPATGDPLPTDVLHLVCVTHGNVPVDPKSK